MSTTTPAVPPTEGEAAVPVSEDLWPVRATPDIRCSSCTETDVHTVGQHEAAVASYELGVAAKRYAATHCKFADCDRDHFANGYCESHSRQLYRAVQAGGDETSLKPIRAYVTDPVVRARGAVEKLNPEQRAALLEYLKEDG